MAEGRVRNEGGGFGLVLKMEYFITDQQGNTRISFEDNNGAATLIQENSYYAFGMQMASGYTPTTTTPNKKLYNAGSEWQDDIDGLADYYSTFFREYDPVIGRFNGVDPMAEVTDNLSIYHYSYNNPINFNDPMGDAAGETLGEQMQREFREWRDAKYGNGSFRDWDFWGLGGGGDDGMGGNGGGGGTYAELKADLDYHGHEPWRDEEDEWKDLTKEKFMSFITNARLTFSSDGALEDYAGNKFEQIFHLWAKFSVAGMAYYLESYKPNSTPDNLDNGNGTMLDANSSRNHVIVDAKASTIGINTSTGKLIRYIEAAWFEIKLKYGNINLSTSKGQIAYEIDVLYKKHKNAAINGAAEYNIVTASNSSVSRKIYARGASYNIMVRQWKPQYSETNGIINIRFGYELAPIRILGGVFRPGSRFVYWGNGIRPNF